jgi:Leucine-rich repeat (LRR) protein
MMNTRFPLLALSIAIAASSLALFKTVVGGTASTVSGEVSGIETDALTRDRTDTHLLPDQKSDISQDEALSLTEPISIYLPLVDYKYVRYPAERAALMALYNSTNGDDCNNNTGWGTDSYHCEWYGVTCDEDEHVTVLDLDSNWLTGTIPAEIGNLPMLTGLRITGTNLSCGKVYCEYALRDPLPPEIGNLVGLQYLDLSYNQLTSLPPEIGNMTNLSGLSLVNNRLTSLPQEIGNLARLQWLELQGNQLTSLPPDIGNLVSLWGLRLSGNQLSSLPAEIGNLASLQELSLHNNQLTSLPPQIGKLANLLELDLESNQLASLPPDIGNLVNLQYLGLGGNELSSLPPEIGNLASLQYLNLNFNQFTSLPPGVYSLVSLGILSLSGNQLKSLPLEIGNLMNLQGLRLDHNQLTSLPSEIGNLSSLLVLNLDYNQLSGAIPAFLSNLGNLWQLTLNENPDLTCWETQEARDWALSLQPYYEGPTCFFP